MIRNVFSLLVVILVSTGIASYSVPANAEPDADFLPKMTVLAEKGNPEAAYHVGMIHHMGLAGAKKDPKTALNWFEKSAQGGFALGAYKLGCYYGGQEADVVEKDPEKELQYKTVAADAGYALAQSDLAAIYWERKKLPEAFKWIKLAADQGDAKALYNTSIFYKDGMGTEKNLAMAYSYFKLAQLATRGSLNENAQQALKALSANMAEAEISAAEKYAAEWKAKPTTITAQALQGLAHAEEFLKASGL